MPSRRSPFFAALCPLLLVLTACASEQPVGPPHRPVPETTVAATTLAAAVVRDWEGSADQRAWQQGYYPLDPQREWLPSDAFHNGDDKFAFQSGRLELRAALPVDGPAQTALTWPDGSHATVSLLPAAEVFRSLTTGKPDCRNHCGPLAVTAVRPGTRPIATSRGQVTIPVWEFTIKGYTEAFAYPAVAPQQTHRQVPPAEPEPVIADGSGAGWAGTSPDGLTLHGIVPMGACTTLVSTEAYETTTAVVLIARTNATPLPPGAACAASVLARPADFHLRRPLGSRTVLNLGTGRPETPAPARS